MILTAFLTMTCCVLVAANGQTDVITSSIVAIELAKIPVTGKAVSLKCSTFHTWLEMVTGTKTLMKDWRCGLRFSTQNVSRFQTMGLKDDNYDGKLIFCEVAINSFQSAVDGGSYNCVFLLEREGAQVNNTVTIISEKTLDVVVDHKGEPKFFSNGSESLTYVDDPLKTLSREYRVPFFSANNTTNSSLNAASGVVISVTILTISGTLAAFSFVIFIISIVWYVKAQHNVRIYRAMLNRNLAVLDQMELLDSQSVTVYEGRAKAVTPAMDAVTV